MSKRKKRKGLPANNALGTVMEETSALERRKALRALLKNPLITADEENAEVFGLIRRHTKELREWLTRYPGWSLHVDSETARLRKLPPDHGDDTRPAADKSRTTDPLPFTRRRYALFCLALAALEQGERQVTLARLFDDILQQYATDPALEQAGLRFDPELHDHRRDLVHAVRLLINFGVLRRLDGDEQAYLSGRGDALYNVRRGALVTILNVRRGPSTVASEALETRLHTIVEEALPETDEGRNRRIRSFLYRKLLDDPVLYYDRLDEAEHAYLIRQRPFIISEIEKATGLLPEVRREGMAMVDEQGDLTDFKMPDEGTDGHLALLLAEYLADRLRAVGGRVVVGPAALHQHVIGLIDTHGKSWRKGAREPGAAEEMTDLTLDRLAALSLIERTEEGIVPLPAIARFALAEVTEPKRKTEMEIPIQQGVLF